MYLCRDVPKEVSGWRVVPIWENKFLRVVAELQIANFRGFDLSSSPCAQAESNLYSAGWWGSLLCRWPLGKDIAPALAPLLG